MGVHPSEQLFDVLVVIPLRNHCELVAAGAKHRAVAEDVANNLAGIANVLVPGLVTLGIVNLLEVVHIQNGDGEGRLRMVFDLGIHARFCFQVRMFVFNPGQGIDTRFGMRLRKTPAEFLLLTNLNVDVAETDDQAKAFLLFHHGSLELNMYGLAVHDKAVAQSENAAAFDLRQDVVLRECRKETSQVIRMVEGTCDIANSSKEVRAFFSLRKALHVIVRRSEFTVVAGLRLHHIDADEIAGECMKARVDRALFHYALFDTALFNFLVDIRNGYDDETLIILHARNPHAHIERHISFYPAIDQFEQLGPLKGSREECGVHRLDKSRLVIRVHVQFCIPLTTLEEIRTPAHFGQHVAIIVGVVLDEFIGIHVDVVQIRTAPCKG